MIIIAVFVPIVIISVPIVTESVIAVIRSVRVVIIIRGVMIRSVTVRVVIMRVRMIIRTVPAVITRTVRISVVMMTNAVVMPTVINYGSVPRIIQRMPIFRNCGNRYDSRCCGNRKKSVKIDCSPDSRAVKSFDSDLVAVINFVFDIVDLGIVVSVVFIVVVICISLCPRTKIHNH